MIDSAVQWIASLLQNEPEGAAFLLLVLAAWNAMNTILIVVFTASDVRDIKKALRKCGIWV
jgi:hypothetical protein